MLFLLITKAAVPSCSKMVALEVLENSFVFYYQKQQQEGKCSIKKLFSVKNYQISQKNTCVGVSF